VSLLNECLLL